MNFYQIRIKEDQKRATVAVWSVGTCKGPRKPVPALDRAPGRSLEMYTLTTTGPSQLVLGVFAGEEEPGEEDCCIRDEEAGLKASQ